MTTPAPLTPAQASALEEALALVHFVAGPRGRGVPRESLRALVAALAPRLPDGRAERVHRAFAAADAADAASANPFASPLATFLSDVRSAPHTSALAELLARPPVAWAGLAWPEDTDGPVLLDAAAALVAAASTPEAGPRWLALIGGAWSPLSTTNPAAEEAEQAAASAIRWSARLHALRAAIPAPHLAPDEVPHLLLTLGTSDRLRLADAPHRLGVSIDLLKEAVTAWRGEAPSERRPISTWEARAALRLHQVRPEGEPLARHQVDGRRVFVYAGPHPCAPVPGALAHADVDGARPGDFPARARAWRWLVPLVEAALDRDEAHGGDPAAPPILEGLEVGAERAFLGERVVGTRVRLSFGPRPARG